MHGSQLFYANSLSVYESFFQLNLLNDAKQFLLPDNICSYEEKSPGCT